MSEFNFILTVEKSKQDWNKAKKQEGREVSRERHNSKQTVLTKIQYLFNCYDSPVKYRCIDMDLPQPLSELLSEET